jgi:hypothetical protein
MMIAATKHLLVLYALFLDVRQGDTSTIHRQDAKWRHGGLWGEAWFGRLLRKEMRVRHCQLAVFR